MFNFARIFFMGLLFIFGACQKSSADFSAMTYNIRLDIAVDGDNAWPHRKELLVSQLQNYKPDIFGVQEAMPRQMDYLSQQLPNYNFIGHGRDGGNLGEYSAIFYNTEKFSAARQSTFWLSPTPAAKSMGWDAAYPRICTYGLFTHITSGKKIWVFNTHLDHIGVKARQKGMLLILKKIHAVNTENFSVMLMGDFNVEPDDRLMTSLQKQMHDAKSISKTAPIGPKATFNAFKPFKLASRRIDYIMLAKPSEILVESYAVLYDAKSLKYPSDHFPVLVNVNFR